MGTDNLLPIKTDRTDTLQTEFSVSLVSVVGISDSEIDVDRQASS